MKNETAADFMLERKIGGCLYIEKSAGIILIGRRRLVPSDSIFPLSTWMQEDDIGSLGLKSRVSWRIKTVDDLNVMMDIHIHCTSTPSANAAGTQAAKLYPFLVVQG